MKKIGILTFHRAINYGALLQCYGLQEKLTELGADAEVVDYRSSYVENAYRLLWGLNKKKLNSWKTTLKGVPQVKRKKKLFRRFSANNLKLTEACTRDNIAKVTGDMDIIITGSDQVWNMDVCGNDHTYMLDFVNEKNRKASYAVSLGGYKFPEDEIKMLQNFGSLSIRESKSRDYVADITGQSVNLDVDPTLLVKADVWKKVLTDKKPSKPYIFIYSVHPQNRMAEYAVNLAKEKGLEVYHLHNRVKKDIKEEGINVLSDCSPEEFLTMIYNAEYVVTNSFHGTVFSIIFHKQFLSELETKGGFNNRVWDLLNELGIERRILERKIYYEKDFSIDEQINWETVENNLERLRAVSETHLQELLK